MTLALLISVTFNLMLIVGVTFGLIVVSRTRTIQSVAAVALGLVGVGVGIAVLIGREPFLMMRLVSYLLFGHLTLYLFASGRLLWSRKRSMGIVVTLCGGAVVAVAVDAFFVEPHWLDTTVVTLMTDKLDEPLRLAVLADIQTDQFGSYERRVFRRCLAAKPDMILLAGDYLQVNSDESWHTLHREMNAYLQQIEFSAPLGIYAVRGNTDHPLWVELFDGLPVERIEATTTIDLGPLRLTGLGVLDSFNRHLRVGSAAGYHIVLGHAPDFALGEIDADLLVAGHTHGGQVALPWIGPLMTASQVPRSWATGVTSLDGNRTLIVSRGIGMERRNAPRLRFLCRPQLMIVDLRPEGDRDGRASD